MDDESVIFGSWMTTRDLYSAMALLESHWPVKMDGGSEIQAVAKDEQEKCFYLLGYEPTKEDLEANNWILVCRG